MLLSLLVLRLQVRVLLGQCLVHAVERVDLQDIAAQHLSQRGKLLLQSHYLSRIAALHTPQFLQQLLRAFLLLFQLSHQRVVVYLRHHLVVLHGKLLILILHLTFVHLRQFQHLLALEHLLAHRIKEETNDESHHRSHYTERNLRFLVHKKYLFLGLTFMFCGAKLRISARTAKGNIHFFSQFTCL